MEKFRCGGRLDFGRHGERPDYREGFFKEIKMLFYRSLPFIQNGWLRVGEQRVSIINQAVDIGF